MDSFESRAHRVQRDMPPVSNDTWARLVPFVPPIAGKIIPVKRLLVEFTVGPLSHPVQRIALRYWRAVGVGSIFRFRKRVAVFNIRTYPDDEEAPAALCHTEMPRVEDLPLDSVSCKPVTAELIAQQLLVGAISHAVHVFDDEGLRSDDPEHAIELLVEEVNLIT